MHEQQRAVVSITDAQGVIEGAGLKVNRAISTGPRRHMDPFLLLDHFGPITCAPGEEQGVPDHPHRGFETVSYLLSGSMEHRDSTGGHSVLGPGDLQWMTAGSGIVHSELLEAGFKRDGGVLHGFQLWVNLPAAEKMTTPGYQDVAADEVPVVRADEGRAIVRVIAGNVLGQQGAVATRTAITVVHVSLKPGARLALPIPADEEVGAYLFGDTTVVDGAGTEATHAQLVRFGDGDVITLSAPEDNAQDAEVLVLAGTPIGEPIVSYGPFVMNTEAEIRQALVDYKEGRMGHIPVNA